MLPKRSKWLRTIFAFLLVAVSASLSAHAGSLRFFGNGVNDIDRVKIRIDPPGPPADVGSTDFTIEFWLRSQPGDNRAPAVSCGANINWIYGNIVFDRDRYNQGRAFGISLGAGRVVFGTLIGTSRTICGTTDLRDGAWHHIAAQRSVATGQMSLHVDGVLEAQANGAAGDISYPDNAVPGNFCRGRCTNSDPFIVLGAEKHDAGSAYPSFSGWLDEVRLSTTRRYPSNFTPVQTAFAADATTAALYHFDESSGTLIIDSAFGGASPGELKFGGNPAGPLRDSSEPFTQSAGSLQFSAASYSVAEGAPSVTVNVTRVGGSLGPVSVDYATAAATATPGADYVTALGTLSWGSGDAAPKSVTVLLNADSDVEGAETFSVALSNATGGAVLGALATTVVTISDDDAVANNPLPVLAGIAPTSALAGSAAFTLTVTGSSFVNGSVVRWNGSARSTTFVSTSLLLAAITATDLASAGTAAVSVFTPTPGGGTSVAIAFSIAAAANPSPVLTSMTPTSAPSGSAGFVLTVNGSGFVSGSVVRWNGGNRSTTFVSSTRLTASIAAADLASAGTAAVTVFTPTPGGGTSVIQTFTVALSGGGGAVPGLVAAYGFNSGSGTAIVDSSGNGNGGTASGTTWTTGGRFGSALTFNGSSSLVSVADSNSLDVTAMTLEAWVYPTVQPSGWRTVIEKEQPGGAIYYLQAGSSTDQPATGVYASGGERTLYGGTRLLANTWTHLAATYDGATQRLYVNGVQVASRAQTGAIATSSGALRVGGNAVWGEYFQGRIDEARIYNRALSQAEIQTDMITPISP